MTKKLYIVFFVFISCGIFAQSQASLTVTVNKYEPDCQLGAAKINVQGGTPPYYFQWSSGAVGDTVSSLNGGSYTVHVSDSDTGVHKQDITFTIAEFFCNVYISDRFTPNSDGINDTWFIGKSDQYPKFLLEVFDRWGQLVHVQRGQYTAWDGTHIGLKLPDATYYYVFFFEEGKTKKLMKGSVTIVR